MEYIVQRASQLGNKIQPCEEAKQETIAYNAYKDSEEKVWTIEINTIKQLMEFQYKYGDIIIRDSILYKGYHEILIYDDYIE